MGTLARPHGIKGEICIDWHADSPLLLDTPLWLQKGKDAPRRVKIAAVRSHKERPLLLLEGVADRTAAEALRGCKLFVRREDLPEPDDDEVYLEDLLDCDVVLPDGARIGRLDHFEYPAGLEMWVIMPDPAGQRPCWHRRFFRLRGPEPPRPRGVFRVQGHWRAAGRRGPARW